MLEAVRALALDVDGVLTDGTFWWGPDGEEWKRFSFVDIMGVSIALKAGLKIALVSGEDSPLIDRFATKMKIVDVEKNCKDKYAAIRRLAERWRIPLTDFCFMGDDINDLEALACVGVSAAPSGAHVDVLRRVTYVSQRPGGNGAVRELVDAILAARIHPE